jgi:hypothetical protein
MYTPYLLNRYFRPKIESIAISYTAILKSNKEKSVTYFGHIPGKCFEHIQHFLIAPYSSTFIQD